MRGESLDVAVEDEVEIQTALHFPLAIYFPELLRKKEKAWNIH